MLRTTTPSRAAVCVRDQHGDDGESAPWGCAGHHRGASGRPREEGGSNPVQCGRCEAKALDRAPSGGRIGAVTTSIKQGYVSIARPAPPHRAPRQGRVGGCKVDLHGRGLRGGLGCRGPTRCGLVRPSRLEQILLLPISQFVNTRVGAGRGRHPAGVAGVAGRAGLV